MHFRKFEKHAGIVEYIFFFIQFYLPKIIIKIVLAFRINFGIHFKQKKAMVNFITFLAISANFSHYVFIKIIAFTCTKKYIRF